MAEQTATIGSRTNFWLHTPSKGFDLTHPPTPEDKVATSITFNTTTSPVTIDPSKTALVIVDMQNFFLSPSLGKPLESKGLQAADKLLELAIPACRKAKIQIIWLNWGLTQEDIDEMPPSALRAFGGLEPSLESHHSAKEQAADGSKRERRRSHGLGSDMGQAQLQDGTTVDAGKLLMRDQWNAALYPPLEKSRQENQRSSTELRDVWIHKNRLSGLWGASTECTAYLEAAKLRTLIFAGVNTDQCVGGSLTDAFTKGYDCLMLSDGAATSSPESAQQIWQKNTADIYGFVLSCQDLAEGVGKMAM